jgi:hypothetical protein
LSEQQKAELIKMVADAKAKNEVEATPTAAIDMTERWVNVGKSLGAGLVATAKEMGIAVNEFASTPIGRLATVLIVWHMLGSQIIHIIIGLSIWVIGGLGIRYLVNKCYPDTIIYSKEQKNIFGNPVVESIQREEISNDLAIGITIVGLAITGIGLLVMVTG